jgi:hypothetical protein
VADAVMREATLIDSHTELPEVRVRVFRPSQTVMEDRVEMSLQPTDQLLIRTMIPEKREMVCRPKGAVLQRAVQVLGQLADSHEGVWGELDEVVKGNPELEELRRGALVTMIGSKANNTLKTYLPYTVKWQQFATKFKFTHYPAGRMEFVLFVQSLIKAASEKGNKSGVISSAVYAVDFVHALRGMQKPGAQDCVRMMLEGAKRRLARPTIRKNHLTMESVKKLIAHFTPDLSDYTLNGLRYSVYCALAFVLEARFADIIDICPNNIVDYGDRMVVFLEEQKMDQYREGSFIPFVNTNERLGAYALVSEILNRLPEGQEDMSIFRRVNTGKVKGEFFRDEAMSYTLVREGIKKALTAIGENADDYGLHSFRSGAKSHVDRKQHSLPLDQRIPERLSNKHGRWAENSKSALGYTADDAEDQLLVPSILGL